MRSKLFLLLTLIPLLSFQLMKQPFDQGEYYGEEEESLGEEITLPTQYLL